MTNETKQEKVEIAEDDPDTDLEIEADKQESGTLEGKYLLACELYDVVPCSFFLKHMHDQEVILRHYGLGNLGAKAIALLRLRLSRFMSLFSLITAAIASVLRSDIPFPERSIFWIVVQKHRTLLILDVSQNRISKAGALVIAKALEANEVLTTLRIGHNIFGVEGAHALLKGITSPNSVVSELDISGIEINKEFISMSRYYLVPC
jgi:hypothetical protein